MTELYPWLKIIHIISATLFFGTGIGSAFYLLQAHLSKDVAAIAFTTRNVVFADWAFTTPGAIVQPLTGFAMAYLGHFPLTATWISVSTILYIVTIACWLPVVWLQIKMRDLAAQANDNNTSLPALYYRYFNIWFWSGWPAFISIMAIFYLMVVKL